MTSSPSSPDLVVPVPGEVSAILAALSSGIPTHGEARALSDASRPGLSGLNLRVRPAVSGELGSTVLPLFILRLVDELAADLTT